ncbi:MAG TPA: hypothetical protein DIC36_00925, partial [Gammaproteobacteria bacterium]|nr:hypothetical protein [Gammaproteobacteria bacterium]
LSAVADVQTGVDAISTPDGVYTLTITAVASARVHVRGAGYDWPYTAGPTGEVTAKCNAGGYVIDATAGGYVIDSQTVNVSDDTAIALVCTPVTLPASSDPLLCICTLDLRETFGNAVSAALPDGATIKITANPASSLVDYRNAATVIPAEAFSDGRISVELPRGATTEWKLGSFGKATVVVADAASQNVSSYFA